MSAGTDNDVRAEADPTATPAGGELWPQVALTRLARNLELTRAAIRAGATPLEGSLLTLPNSGLASRQGRRPIVGRGAYPFSRQQRDVAAPI